MTKKNIRKIANMAHQIMIGGEAGERTMRFAKDLSVTLLGGLGAFVLLFVANIVVARVLGPEEYGKYAIFFAIAQVVSLLYVLELDVSALYFLASKDVHKKEITASIMMMFGINILVFTFLAWSAFYFFNFTQVTQNVFVGALGFAVVLSVKRMIDAFLRADEQFVHQAFLRLGEGVVVVVTLGVFLGLLVQRSFVSYAGALAIGGMIFAVIGSVYIRHFFTVRGWTATRMNDIFRYNIFGLINAIINGIVKNADTLVIAAILGTKTAGIYAIYFTASVVIGARVTQLFISVFFPSIRTHVDQIHSVIRKVDRMFVRMFLPLVLCASCGVAVIILLYGDAYPFMWQWIVLGGVYIAVHFFASLYGWILSSMSQRGYKQYNQSYMYGFIFYVGIIAGAYYMYTLTISTFLIALIFYRIVSGIVARKYLNLQHK